MKRKHRPELFYLYEKYGNKAIPDMAKLFGTSEDSIKRVLKRAGYIKPKRSKKPTRRLQKTPLNITIQAIRNSPVPALYRAIVDNYGSVSRFADYYGFRRQAVIKVLNGDLALHTQTGKAILRLLDMTPEQAERNNYEKI